MSRLYVIRHGQASFGRSNYDELSPLGFRQAALVGQHLAAAGIRLDAAFCGDQARQRDTAATALAHLAEPPALEILPALNEFDSEAIMRALYPAVQKEDPRAARAWESMTADRRAFQLVYEATMLRWITGRYDLDGAETWGEFVSRLEGAVTQVRAAHGRGKNVALFTSGGPISAVMRLALGLGDEAALRLTWVIRNASLSQFFYDDQRLSLALFNCTAHLERPGEPELLTYR
ncbi:MAG: histidine phosphatase family protein [Deltaproteobacteria bacterium]|nr:histidine phosphatase family protein [Deltaproteobacteria bacterium]